MSRQKCYELRPGRRPKSDAAQNISAHVTVTTRLINVLRLLFIKMHCVCTPGHLTSAVQRRHNCLLERSGACKTPANSNFLSQALCSSFQEIYSDCCTVAAHKVRAAEPESAPVTFVSFQAKGHRLTPGVTQGQNGILTMVCTREGSGRMLDMIVVPLWHLSRSLVYPSRLRSLV